MVQVFQKRTKQEGLSLRIEKKNKIFGFFTLLLQIPDKTKLPSRNSTKLCYTPQKIYGLKPRPLEIPHDFFLIPWLITPGNSMLFLINPWNVHLLFLQYPQKFHILNSPLLLSGIAQSQKSNQRTEKFRPNFIMVFFVPLAPKQKRFTLISPLDMA